MYRDALVSGFLNSRSTLTNKRIIFKALDRFFFEKNKILRSSQPLLHFQTLCWCYLQHSVLRAEMILESYAEVYSNQFTTRNRPIQLVQCRTKKNTNTVCKSTYDTLALTRNSSSARQPLSRVHVTGILRRLQVKILKT